eukprot:COSAG01_NODE_37076_length_508_cov_3.051345_1_plen_90_part_00
MQDTTQAEIRLVTDQMREIQLEQRFERDMEIARAEVDADTQWRDHSIDQSVKSDCLKPENMESWLMTALHTTLAPSCPYSTSRCIWAAV